MKKQLPIEMTNNGSHYTLHGDYYFPDIELPEASHQTIGHYGRMRKAYLEEHRPGLYTRLLLSGKLYDHLTEINACCSNRMERMNMFVLIAKSLSPMRQKGKNYDYLHNQ